MRRLATAAAVVVALVSGCTSSGDADATEDLESPLSGQQVTVESGTREEFLALHAGSLEPGRAATFTYERFQDDEVVLTETQTEVTLADKQIIATPSGITYWRGTEMFSCTNFEGTKECRPPETVDSYTERSAADVGSLAQRTDPDTGDLTVGTTVGPELLGRSTRCFQVVPADGTTESSALTETCFDDDGLVMARVSIRPDVTETWTATAVDPATSEQVSALLSEYPLD